jgi:methylated-DNA-[protein]-cysteine S-methyltransferase
MIAQWSEYASPIGMLVLVTRGDVLHVLAFAERWPQHRRRLQGMEPGLELVRVAEAVVAAPLDAYFAGDLNALDAIVAAPHGTAFQRRVWERLRSIAAGETSTYGDLARALGTPSACRAVGAANGANPISIVLPCHRVVGGGGQLTGYGGGLERKRWLLEHERAHAGRSVSRRDEVALPR